MLDESILEIIPVAEISQQEMQEEMLQFLDWAYDYMGWQKDIRDSKKIFPLNAFKEYIEIHAILTGKQSTWLVSEYKNVWIQMNASKQFLELHQTLFQEKVESLLAEVQSPEQTEDKSFWQNQRTRVKVSHEAPNGNIDTKFLEKKLFLAHAREGENVFEWGDLWDELQKKFEDHKQEKIDTYKNQKLDKKENVKEKNRFDFKHYQERGQLMRRFSNLRAEIFNFIEKNPPQKTVVNNFKVESIREYQQELKKRKYKYSMAMFEVVLSRLKELGIEDPELEQVKKFQEIYKELRTQNKDQIENVLAVLED